MFNKSRRFRDNDLNRIEVLFMTDLYNEVLDKAINENEPKPHAPSISKVSAIDSRHFP